MIKDKIGYQLPNGGKTMPINDLSGRPVKGRLGMMTQQPIPGTTAFVCIPAGMGLFVQGVEIAKIVAWLDDNSIKVTSKARARKIKGVATDETNS